MFPTSTKDSAVIGTEALAAICAAVRIPVVAIGGISAANAPLAFEAGAAGVAVVSAVFGQEDVATATQRILKVNVITMAIGKLIRGALGCRQTTHLASPCESQDSASSFRGRFSCKAPCFMITCAPAAAQAVNEARRPAAAGGEHAELLVE